MPKFTLDDNVLLIEGDLINPIDIPFDLCCRRLLESGHQELVIDLVGVDKIISQFLGAFVLLSEEARKNGASLKIRCALRVAELFCDPERQ